MQPLNALSVDRTCVSLRGAPRADSVPAERIRAACLVVAGTGVSDIWCCATGRGRDVAPLARRSNAHAEDARAWTSNFCQGHAAGCVGVDIDAGRVDGATEHDVMVPAHRTHVLGDRGRARGSVAEVDTDRAGLAVAPPSKQVHGMVAGLSQTTVSMEEEPLAVIHEGKLREDVGLEGDARASAQPLVDVSPAFGAALIEMRGPDATCPRAQF